MTKTLAVEDFSPHLHTRFLVAGAGGEELELTSATDLSNAQLEQFSLIFTGKSSPWLPQSLYRLIHPLMGDIELFLVPVGPDAAGMRYEAVFCRFVES
jgi:hypothetical protein